VRFVAYDNGWNIENRTKRGMAHSKNSGECVRIPGSENWHCLGDDEWRQAGHRWDLS